MIRFQLKRTSSDDIEPWSPGLIRVITCFLRRSHHIPSSSANTTAAAATTTTATGHVKEKHTKLHVSACISALYYVACHWVLPVCVYCHYLTLHSMASFILCLPIMNLHFLHSLPNFQEPDTDWVEKWTRRKDKISIETADLPQMEGAWLSSWESTANSSWLGEEVSWRPNGQCKCCVEPLAGEPHRVLSQVMGGAGSSPWQCWVRSSSWRSQTSLCQCFMKQLSVTNNLHNTTCC